MNGTARLLGSVAVVICAATVRSGAQTMLQPTPEPGVTAERTEWYLSGEPITYDGNVYYPVGAAVHFNRYEMVRSGSFRGIPLYARTTIEPYSIVFVPLAGGVMQPYERRRGGDVAGTVGSTTPGLPVVIPTRSDTPEGIPQAPAPPVVTGSRMARESQPVPAAGEAAHPTVGTSGRAAAIPEPTPYEPLVRPQGLNAVFVDFDGVRWFLDGPAVSVEGRSLTRVGSRYEFPVYAIAQEPDTIYIPVTRDPGALVTPFSRRPARR